MTSEYGSGHGQADPGLGAIMSERRQLINLAYRLLGSLAEAEDAVQEAYARWYSMSRQQQEAIESPGAWLTKVASRICLGQRADRPLPGRHRPPGARQRDIPGAHGQRPAGPSGSAGRHHPDGVRV
jgi:DNA-directed RNA polymerase specialized sigma24 family protein